MTRSALFALTLGIALGLASVAQAADLARCDTSVRGQPLQFLYDPDSEGLRNSRSMRERLYGGRGTISCPGLVTLRVLTPELTDAERAPFCLQWDKSAKTYIGYDLGARDAFLGCKSPKRSFCERVNRSKSAAARWGGAVKELALTAGTETALHAAGVVSVKGPAAVIGEKLVTLGSTAAGGSGATVALGALAVTAVAAGGAIYLCADSGAEAAALQAAPPPQLDPGLAVQADALPGSSLPD